MAGYQEFWLTTQDGLKLYARDYANPAATLTLLCLPGLTRNSADFHDLATRLGQSYRVIAMDPRGRGRSDYDSEPARYRLPTYVADALALLDALDLARVALLGTSMGGLISMLMAAVAPDRVCGVVLNDIGPVVMPSGLARIQSYVGKRAVVETWADAVDATKANNGAAFPDLTEAQWLAFARRLFRENAQGRPELAYDPAISAPIKEDQQAAVPGDLWQVFDAMKDIPVLVIRGALSDILSGETVAQMAARHRFLHQVEISRTGHAPLLTEPEAEAAIWDFLAGIDLRGTP